MTYIEIRLLLKLDCELKIQKINNILFFLRNHNFLNNLTVINDDIRAEDIFEQDKIMSLTIDTRNDTLRFKFWNGISTMWLFHTKDLYDALDTGREKFTSLYDKYEPITDVLLNFKKQWSTSIDKISYNYNTNNDIDVIYDIVFVNEAQRNNYSQKILSKIYHKIDTLDIDIDNYNFKINTSYQSECIPCQKKQQES